MTPELRVRLVRRSDGGVVLHCDRRDGSSTWQRHTERQAQFFGFHDLTHFAIETTMGARQGFFGLLADGWDIAETDGKSARGPLPPEAIGVEHLVGLLERERLGGAMSLTADEVIALLDQATGDTAGPREGERTNPLTNRLTSRLTNKLTDELLAAARARMQALHAEWASLPPGNAMELSFDRAAFSDAGDVRDANDLGESPSQTA